MVDYSIRPIALCDGPRDISQYAYRVSSGIPCYSACYIWYLEGSQPKTIVDAGANAATFGGEVPERNLVSVEDGLGKLGLKPEDIGTVIMTHLHRDHIALGHLYRNARFIVQKKELEYARNPHALDAPGYSRSMFEGLKLETVDGETGIAPGISVLLTPGHTPGGQSVEVNTKSGKAIITGFCCTRATFMQTESMKDKGWEVAIPLVHTDTREAYDSVLRVKKRADIILPLHDPDFAGKQMTE